MISNRGMLLDRLAAPAASSSLVVREGVRVPDILQHCIDLTACVPRVMCPVNITAMNGQLLVVLIRVVYAM